jgi:hypothetical protein
MKKAVVKESKTENVKDKVTKTTKIKYSVAEKLWEQQGLSKESLNEAILKGLVSRPSHMRTLLTPEQMKLVDLFNNALKKNGFETMSNFKGELVKPVIKFTKIKGK